MSAKGSSAAGSIAIIEWSLSAHLRPNASRTSVARDHDQDPAAVDFRTSAISIV
jgi:hypothetical protein